MTHKMLNCAPNQGKHAAIQGYMHHNMQNAHLKAEMLQVKQIKATC